MKKLVDEFEAAKAEEEKLKNEKDDCEKKLKRAESLTEKLASENQNWKVSLSSNVKQRENLVGDILISSGIIAYLGVFQSSYRDDCIKSWIQMLKSLEIKATEDNHEVAPAQEKNEKQP